MTAPFFLDIDPRIATDPDAPYCVLPLPYERTVSYGGGTGQGPAAILRASHEVEDFDELLKRPLDVAVQTLPPVPFEGSSEPEAMAAIEQAAAREMKRQRFVLALGGEHAVTPPLVKAACNAFGVKTVLQLDAHTDLRDAYGGSPHSHACAMRRCRDLGVNTVHVGIRSCSAAEYREWIEPGRTTVFWAADIHTDTGSAWIDAVSAVLTGPVYCSIDIDVFDPSLVPGTGTPDPGGLTWQQVTRLIRAVVRRHNVVAADIVEIAPIAGSQVSEFVAARLGARLLMEHLHRTD